MIWFPRGRIVSLPCHCEWSYLFPMIPGSPYWSSVNNSRKLTARHWETQTELATAWQSGSTHRTYFSRQLGVTSNLSIEHYVAKSAVLRVSHLIFLSPLPPHTSDPSHKPPWTLVWILPRFTWTCTSAKFLQLQPLRLPVVCQYQKSSLPSTLNMTPRVAGGWPTTMKITQKSTKGWNLPPQSARASSEGSPTLFLPFHTNSKVSGPPPSYCLIWCP